jgi:toxin-antitoxin system PIN domain toxin
MRHLLDVNLLIAAIHADHPQHSSADAWLEGREIVLCPLTELGFLRITSNPRLVRFSATMERAREALEAFASERKVERIKDDLDAVESHPGKSDEVTDHYLADLAGKHGLKLATFDQGLKQASVELVS